MDLKPIRAAKYLLHLVALSFLAWLFFAAFSERLGGDPIPEIIHYLGKGALHLLLLTLLVSPLAKVLHKGQLYQLRRPLGLWCLFWATLHFSAWSYLGLQLDWQLIFAELTSRTYLIIGAVSWLTLLALGITSINSIRRKMGRYWQQLHYLIYPILIAVTIHFWWSLKSGWVEPAIYLFAAIILLLLRIKPVKTFIAGLNAKE